MEYIIYDGIDSRTLGVYMASVGGNSQLINMSPASRSVTESIAGRHGEFVMERTYAVRDIDIELYITRTDSTSLSLISRWLGRLGTYDLILSTEPYKVYKATVEQGLGLSVYNPRQSTMSVTFTCHNPFAYSKFSTGNLGFNEYDTGLLYNSGVVYTGAEDDYNRTTFWNNPVIFHGGNVDLAMPKIIVNGAVGNSSSIVTITHWTDSTKTVIKDRLVIRGLADSIIDSEKLETRFISNGLLNTNVEGTYFKLYGVGDMSNLEQGAIVLTSKTSATLSSRTSSNSLVGKALNVFEHEGDINSQIIVQSQTGNNITFSTNGDLTIGKNYVYKAIDYSRGLNYFTLNDGGASTSSITRVGFDFKFVYL